MILSLLEDDENKQPVMNSAALKRALKKELPGASPLPTARASKPSKAAPTTISIEASSIWDYSHAEADAAPEPADSAEAAADVSKENSSSASKPVNLQNGSAAEQAKAAPRVIRANPGADVLKLDDDDDGARALRASGQDGSAPGFAEAPAQLPAQLPKPTAEELLVRLKQDQSKQQQEVRSREDPGKKPENIADFLLLGDASGTH